MLPVSRTLAALDIGGGVTGFFTNRVGVSWDVRYFRSLGAGDNNGISFGNEQSVVLAGDDGRRGSIRQSYSMSRRQFLCCTIVLLLSTAGIAADESLRIVPVVHEKQVVVTLEMADAYTDEIRETISSGLRTTFTYDLQLRMLVGGWVDRTVATAVVTVSDQYDNLTRRHTLSRVVDGRTDESVVTEDEAVVRQWLTTLTRLPLCETTKTRAQSRVLRAGQPRASGRNDPSRLPSPMPSPARRSSRSFLN